MPVAWFAYSPGRLGRFLTQDNIYITLPDIVRRDKEVRLAVHWTMNYSTNVNPDGVAHTWPIGNPLKRMCYDKLVITV
jgi:hypothetical protein